MDMMATLIMHGRFPLEVKYKVEFMDCLSNYPLFTSFDIVFVFSMILRMKYKKHNKYFLNT